MANRRLDFQACTLVRPAKPPRGSRPCVISVRGYRFTSGQSHSNLAVSVLHAEMTVRMLALELLLPPPRFSTRRVFAFYLVAFVHLVRGPGVFIFIRHGAEIVPGGPGGEAAWGVIRAEALVGDAPPRLPVKGRFPGPGCICIVVCLILRNPACQTNLLIKLHISPILA